MKNFVFAIVVFVAACGSSSANQAGDDPVAKPAAKEQTSAATAHASCDKEVERVCPDGMVDSCDLKLTANHECVKANAANGPVCEAEIATICPDGQVDICERREASPTHHLCVLK